MGTQTEANLAHIGFVLVSLLLFGCLYATFINWLRRSGLMEGFTAFLVVGGVLITLLGNKFIHQPDPISDFLIELACFAAAGMPMVIEAWISYAQARRRNEQRAIQEASNA